MKMTKQQEGELTKIQQLHLLLSTLGGLHSVILNSLQEILRVADSYTMIRFSPEPNVGRSSTLQACFLYREKIIIDPGFPRLVPHPRNSTLKLLLTCGQSTHGFRVILHIFPLNEINYTSKH